MARINCDMNFGLSDDDLKIITSLFSEFLPFFNILFFILCFLLSNKNTQSAYLASDNLSVCNFSKEIL